MFVPRYWSEASHREVFPPRQQVTVRRFGWSSTSQEDADVHARQRLEEAVAVLRAEGPEGLREFKRRERAVAYAGADGLPIREEIVEEHEAAEVVLTRNSYGAVCLNTTRAMFVDVDRTTSQAGCFGCVGFLVGAVLGGIVGALVPGVHWLLGVAGGAVALGLAGLALGHLRHLRDLQGSDPVGWAVGRAREWCEDRLDWLVTVYETPEGARLLPLHSTFDAAEEGTFEFMDFLRADPLYVRMCRLQKCFRARVSPKPWRAGIPKRFPSGGTWPVRDPEKLARRAEWVREYDERTRGYASCRVVETLGGGRRDPQVEEIRRMHDDLSRADSGFELA
jgi:hypothetical protein